MSTVADRPLVFALRPAIDEAARLGLHGCLENHVRDGILAGKKRRQPPRGMPPCALDERVVFVGPGGGLVARVKQTRSPLRARKSWLVTSVRPAPPSIHKEEP